MNLILFILLFYVPAERDTDAPGIHGVRELEHVLSANIKSSLVIKKESYCDTSWHSSRQVPQKY